tara:strand:+ start:26768 stop:27148 length:381 start_codon:yes stop_codon:yes gene_type:complete
MKKIDVVWKIFGGYLLILLLMIFCSTAAAQTYNKCGEDICVVEFNASWNEKNNVGWLHKLTDVGTKRILIDKGTWQKDFSIVVTPTIIVFVNGKETKRFQANIMMEMEAKQTDVQDKIDEIIMEGF